MRKSLILLILTTCLLIACETKTPLPTESPLPQPGRSVLATPMQSPLATPVPSLVEMVAPVINEPIYAGDTELLGQGPAGLPVLVFDVGVTGNELGAAIVGEDGTFVVALREPVFAGQRVGLALGDLNGTPFTRQQMVEYAIIDLPVIGLLFTDIVVQPK